MATRTQSLNRENRSGFPFSGKPSGMSSNVKNREVLGKKATDGLVKAKRKPLQELSCKNLENLTNPVKAVDKVAAKPNQEKVKKTGGRTALGDLTNSSKLLQRGGVKNGLKMPSVAEEGCLHDHRECTKALRHAAMDMDYFLETVGLGKDCSTPIATPKYPPSATTSKLESPLLRLEFDFGGSLSPTASPKLESPVRRNLEQDVDMLQLGMEWDTLDFCCDFQMDSPSK